MKFKEKVDKYFEWEEKVVKGCEAISEKGVKFNEVTK